MFTEISCSQFIKLIRAFRCSRGIEAAVLRVAIPRPFPPRTPSTGNRYDDEAKRASGEIILLLLTHNM